ncbi:MAG: DUF192 domain-containing protein [Gemmatimonadetes bacterium]|nr:DUF192 domain-containing protein [Gemmatimonadota bacterium]
MSYGSALRRVPKSSTGRRLVPLLAALAGLVLTRAAGAGLPSAGGDSTRFDGGAATEVQEYARVVFDADTVVAEIASTPRQHEMGLMFRDSVPPGTGMLFVFDEEEVRGFWMDNTHVDLDVAFIDSSLRIVGFEQLDAMDKEVKDSPAPFMYALEVPRGWFEAHGVSVGDSVVIDHDGIGRDHR